MNSAKLYDIQYVANSVEKAILDEALHHIGPKCFQQQQHNISMNQR